MICVPDALKPPTGLVGVQDAALTNPVSEGVGQVTVGPPTGLEGAQDVAVTLPVSLSTLQVMVRPATGPPLGVQVATLTKPVSVVLQVMVWPPPEEGAQELALTKPVSDVGQAVVCVEMFAGETTVPTAQELTFEVTLVVTLPPAKLFVVVTTCVRPLVATAEVMVGELNGAMIVR